MLDKLQVRGFVAVRRMLDAAIEDAGGAAIIVSASPTTMIAEHKPLWVSRS